MIRGGRHVGDRTFFPQHADAGAPRRGRAGVSRAALCRAAGAADDRRHRTRGDHDALAEVLSAQAGQRVEIVGNPGGERRVWLTMATAECRLRDPPEARAEGDAGGPARRAAGGARAAAPRRSASNASTFRTRWASAAVASCVIFDRLAMQTGEYRRFNVTPAGRRRRLRGDARSADAPLRADRCW